MTICIGALCSDLNGHPSKVAIVASDRMVTFGGITEFEHEIPKITEITSKIVTLTAGDALRGSRVSREVMAQTPAGAPTVRGVAESVASRYVELRRQQIDSDIFHPRGIDIQAFYGGLQQRLLGPLAGALDGQVAEFNYGVELLIAGTDDSGSHLYSVLNPGGQPNDFHQIGFHAIGSGMLHALQSIISFGHTGRRALYDTLFTVYVAKKRAEVAPGVGRDTDIGIITESGITWLAEEHLKNLEKIYNDYQRPVSKEIKEEVAKLDILKKKQEGEQQ